MTSCHERRLQDQVGDDLGGVVMEAGGDVAVDTEGEAMVLWPRQVTLRLGRIPPELLANVCSI